jgi:hypothetical protein
MTTALGGGASQSLSSPQGQIAQSDTEIIAQEYDKLLCLFNQVNPDYATGRFQDGIGRIYFMDRISAQGNSYNRYLHWAGREHYQPEVPLLRRTDISISLLIQPLFLLVVLSMFSS